MGVSSHCQQLVIPLRFGSKNSNLCQDCLRVGQRSLSMNTHRLLRRLLLITFLAVMGSPGAVAVVDGAALPFVSPMFGDNMVLQRGKSNAVWGWTTPGQTVQVVIGSNTSSGVANADGYWVARIEPPVTPGPHSFKVSGPQTAEFHNVLVGDVWLCGGQSNMELPLSRTRDGDAAIAAADHPDIRLFTVSQKAAYSPAALVSGRWKVCSPASIAEDGGFSAVGYYFALKVRSETGVPIGLIKNCLGGTPAESWTSPESLRRMMEFGPALDEVKRLRYKGGTEYGNFISHWYDEFDVGHRENWSAADHDDRGWKPVSLANGFLELGIADTPAVVYFRKTLTLPDPLPPGGATIHLGVVERMDTVYLNGEWVGASAWVENPRKYSVAPGILKPGANVLTVRVFKTKPDGGFRSKPEEIRMVLGDQSEIPLADGWNAKLSVDARPPQTLPFSFENWPTMPGVLYDGMIAPVAPFAITGAIWYQGEANADRAAQYRTLLPTMIGDWRKAFGQGDFPFYIVSLSSFMPHRETPGDDAWAELREAQDFTARTVPHSGLAVTIDLGDAHDIHPQDKKEVGDRLALLALAKHYKKPMVFSGPRFVEAEQIPGALKLRFDQALVVKGDRPEEFCIAGEDRKWHWAEARIEGDCVVVSSPEVPEPRAARYAWQANPRASLFNSDGLPAIPFRTDSTLVNP
jgi:sialate O-acetylesterase